ADIQVRMEKDVTVVKEINAAEPEPTVFNDDEVTMTMAQTLIKMKAEKAKILNEQMAKSLQDEKIEQAAASILSLKSLAASTPKLDNINIQRINTLYNLTLVQPQAVAEDEDDNEVPAAPTPPSPTPEPSPPPQEHIPSPTKLHLLHYHHHHEKNLLNLLIP
nr:hypothetical protein [Tanacetum cinerariifolium]